MDRDRRYLFVNHAFNSYYGKDTRTRFEGRTVADVLSPDLAARVSPYVERALAGEVVEYGGEKEVPGGKPETFRAHYVPDRDPDGAVLGFFAIIHDTTETTRALDSMRRMELDLIRAAKLESLGVLAGGIAHDFNNLLTGIVGSIEVFTHGGSGDAVDIAACMSRVRENCERAQSLAGQLLTFSKGGEPVTRMAAPAPIVRTATEFAMRGTSVRLIHDLPEDLWPVEVDQAQIQQVFNNVTLNAQQALPDGGTIQVIGRNLRIDEPTVPGRPEGTWVVITVSDDGVGISREHLDRIFDPYFSTRPGGAGLGLSAAFSIIRNHGGWIDVRSNRGSGTSVELALPARPDAHIHTASAEVIHGHGRILVMDDEDAVREVAGEMLEILGYSASLVNDGATALACWKAAAAAGEPFDAVIMDLSIPGGMGGKESVRRLLELDPDAVALVSSGYSNDPIMANPRDHGFRGVIRKPYFISELSRVLADALG